MFFSCSPPLTPLQVPGAAPYDQCDDECDLALVVQHSLSHKQNVACHIAM